MTRRLPVLLLPVFILGLPGRSPADVVINEVFYNQPGSVETLEFVELHNTGPDAVDLTGWAFTDGIQFAFRAGTRIEAGGFLPVVASLSDFLVAHPGVRTAGAYEGNLSNSGERLALRDERANLVDAVRYSHDEDWPQEADGDGASLELIDPSVPRDVPSSWAAGSPPTPGAVNGAAGRELVPTAYDVRIRPERITSSDPVTVRTRVWTNVPLQSVLLRVSTGGETRDYNLRDDGVLPDEAAGDGEYAITLEPFANRTLVRAKIVLADARANQWTWPAGDDESDFHAWFVYDGDVDTRSPIVWIFLSEAKLRTLAQNAQVRSFSDPRYRHFDDSFEGFVVLEGEVHRKVAIRHRGGFASRHAGRLKYSWRLELPDWDRYHGREDLLIQGNMHWDDRWMRGDNGLQDKLCFMTFDRLRVPSPRTRFIRLMVNGEFFGYHVEVEAVGEEFLERNGFTGAGDLYKHGRTFQAHHFPLSPSEYARAYKKKSNDREDYSSIRRFCEELAAATRGGTGSIREYLERSIDIESYRRYLAGIILSTHWDSTNNNIQIYQNDLDENRWVRFPWDMDITWGYSRRKPPPAQGHNLHPYDGSSSNPEPNEFGVSALRQAFLRVPEYREALSETIAEALVTTFTETEIHPVVDRIVLEDGAESQMDIDKWNALDGTWNWFPFEFHARYDKTYVSSRRKYLAEFLDREPLLSQPSVEPRPARPEDDLTFVVNALGNRFDLVHDLGPGNLEKVTLHVLAGDEETEFAMRAVDRRVHDFYRVTVPAPGGVPRLYYRFSAIDDGGREGFLPRPEDGYRYYPLDLSTAPAREGDVAINEIMYRARYYNVEFVELKNHLDRAVDLSGWRLQIDEAAPEYFFPVGSIVAPRGFLVVSRDARAVFEYYNIVELASADLPWSLPNDSGTLTLSDASGNVVDRARYEDRAPWPEEPDGGGPSLERVDSRVDADGPSAWASSRRQGTPGRQNSVSAPDIPSQPGDVPERPAFHRGDVDADGRLNVTDAVALLGHLFLGEPEPECRETGDTNNDGRLDLSDAVSLLSFLFSGGDAPVDPGPPDEPCGPDPDAAASPGDLGCARYAPCGM